MISAILKFELASYFKRPMTWVFFILLMVQGVWYTLGAHENYSDNNTFINAPVIVYQNLSGMGLILLIVVAILSGGSLARELEKKTGETLFPIHGNDSKFFWGKSLSVFMVNLFVVAGFPLGMVVLPYLGIHGPERFGPVPLGQLLHGFLILTLPNLVFLVAFSIFLVVFFKRSAAAYMGVVLVLILYFTAVALGEDPPLWVRLMDPFAYTSVMDTIGKLGVAERNTAYLPVTSPLLWNRCFWLALSALLTGASFLRFDFKYFMARPSRKSVKTVKEPASSRGEGAEIAACDLNFTRAAMAGKVLSFAWMEFKMVTRSTVLRIVLLALFLMFLGYDFIWTSAYFMDVRSLPLTSVMTFVRIPMMLMISLLLILFSGELLFRDRQSGTWQILDAMPTPSWVFIFSRFLTLGALGFVISTLLFAAGLTAQLIQGFTQIEWGLYLKDLYLNRQGWITGLCLIAMAFCMGSLSGNRLRGHALSLGLFLFMAVSLDLGLLEQFRFAFPFVPGIGGYSEMNGYGAFDRVLPWYAGVWGTLSLLFLFLAVMFWNRGVDRTLPARFRWGRSRINLTKGGILFCLVCLFGGFQYWIYDQEVTAAGFKTVMAEKREAADYEKTYRSIRKLPRPKITDLQLNLELFPEKREALYHASLVLKNKGTRPITTLRLNRHPVLSLTGIRANDRTLGMTANDTRHGHVVYGLSKPLEPGGSMVLNLDGRLARRGVHPTSPHGDLIFNGTCLDAGLLPRFGFDDGRELLRNKDRARVGLPAITSRMDPPADPFSSANLVYSDQADLLTWDITIGTAGSQEVVGPGKKVKSWTEKNRHYVRYRSERPGPLNFKIISARFDKREFDLGGTRAVIHYHPGHIHNLDVFQDAVTKSAAWLGRSLGPYPHHSLHLVEIPPYHGDALTFANVTALSEQNGWAADLGRPRDRQYIYLLVARELAKQWVEARVSPANVEGAGLFTESIPEYLALAFMADRFGPVDHWLDQRRKDYMKGRGEEAVSEKSLLRADRASYLSRDKGGPAFYALAGQMGRDRFNTWLARWLESPARAGDPVTSRAFYRDLLSTVPSSLHSFCDNWFKGVEPGKIGG